MKVFEEFIIILKCKYNASRNKYRNEIKFDGLEFHNFINFVNLVSFSTLYFIK